MICTAEERSVLERILTRQYALTNQDCIAIRAMLSRPPDAGLRERIISALKENWKERTIEEDADAIIAVLRGEATRDDR